MKKLAFLLAAVAIVAVSACQKNTPEPNDSGIPGYNENEDPNRPSGKDDVTVSPEQYIEETAKALMSALDVENWKNEAEFIHKFVVEMQKKEFKDDKLKKWAEALEDTWYREPHKDGNVTITDAYIRLSDAKGHFEEQPDGTFTQTDADDFQITVLVDGEKVTGTFKCVDSKVPLKVASSGGSSYENDQYTEWANNTYVYVPETANLKILRGSAEFASLDLKVSTTVTDISQVDLFNDNASIDATFKIGVYTLSLQKVTYSPTGASAYIKLLNGQASLITIDAKAGYELDPNPAEGYPVPIKSGNVDATVDVMGRIQVKANIPDAKKFIDTGLGSNKVMQDGDAFKAIVDDLNKTFTAAMYFNGAADPRATLVLEPVAPADGSTYWYINPVLRFSDGASYGVEEYFSQERFGSLVSATGEWMDGISQYIANLFGDI